MCVGVTLWFGWGGVVSGCRLKHYYSTIKMMHGTINIRFTIYAVYNSSRFPHNFRVIDDVRSG